MDIVWFIMLNAGENGEITVNHLLLGIWSEKDSAGHKIMASLGFVDEKAKELYKSVSSKPGKWKTSVLNINIKLFPILSADKWRYCFEL